MSNVITGAWTQLTTDIETHLGLQFGTTISNAISLEPGTYSYRNIAKRDIAKGSDVIFKDSFDSYYEVDGERLIQVAKYSEGKNKIQCYNGKNGILNNSDVYYSSKGNIFVKESSRTVKLSNDRGAVARVDIFANAKRHTVPTA